jgi:hypothetical protein
MRSTYFGDVEVIGIVSIKVMLRRSLYASSIQEDIIIISLPGASGPSMYMLKLTLHVW